MGEWHFTKEEEEVIAWSLAFTIQDGDTLSLDQEKLAENILKEMNT